MASVLKQIKSPISEAFSKSKIGILSLLEGAKKTLKNVVEKETEKEHQLTLINTFWAWKSTERSMLVWIEYYNQFVIYQPFHEALLEPQQNNLSNPEAYSEPCQTWVWVQLQSLKMGYFAKIVNG